MVMWRGWRGDSDRCNCCNGRDSGINVYRNDRDGHGRYAGNSGNGSDAAY